MTAVTSLLWIPFIVVQAWRNWRTSVARRDEEELAAQFVGAIEGDMRSFHRENSGEAA